MCPASLLQLLVLLKRSAGSGKCSDSVEDELLDEGAGEMGVVRRLLGVFILLLLLLLLLWATPRMIIESSSWLMQFLHSRLPLIVVVVVVVDVVGVVAIVVLRRFDAFALPDDLGCDCECDLESGLPLP